MCLPWKSNVTVTSTTHTSSTSKGLFQPALLPLASDGKFSALLHACCLGLSWFPPIGTLKTMSDLSAWASVSPPFPQPWTVFYRHLTLAISYPVLWLERNIITKELRGCFSYCKYVNEQSNENPHSLKTSIFLDGAIKKSRNGGYEGTLRQNQERGSGAQERGRAAWGKGDRPWMSAGFRGGRPVSGTWPSPLSSRMLQSDSWRKPWGSLRLIWQAKSKDKGNPWEATKSFPVDSQSRGEGEEPFWPPVTLSSLLSHPCLNSLP